MASCVCVFVRCSPEILRFCVPTLGELKELNWVFHGSCKLDTTQKSRHSGIRIQLIGFLQQTASKPKSRKFGDRGSRRLTSSWNSAYSVYVFGTYLSLSASMPSGAHASGCHVRSLAGRTRHREFLGGCFKLIQRCFLP